MAEPAAAGVDDVHPRCDRAWIEPGRVEPAPNRRARYAVAARELTTLAPGRDDRARSSTVLRYQVRRFWRVAIAEFISAARYSNLTADSVG
jgi:hypothetical protein